MNDAKMTPGKLIIVESSEISTKVQRRVNLYFPTGVCLID